MNTETLILSTLLKGERDTNARIMTIISRENFHEEKHRIIFDAVKELYDENKRIDVVLVHNRTPKRMQADLGEIIAICDEMPTTFDAMAHVEEILRLSAERDRALLLKTADPSKDPSEQFAEIDRKYSTSQFSQTSAELMSEIVDDWDRDKSRDSIESTINKLSDIGVYQPGTLCMVAARTSVGKSSFMLQEGFLMASLGLKTMIVSLEMPERQIMTRIAAQQTDVHQTKIKKSSAGKLEVQKFADGCKDIGDDLKVVFKPGMSIAQLRSTIISEKYRSGLDVVVVDYLQLIRHEKGENATTMITDTINSLKRLAGQEGVLIICGTQVSRNPDDRQDRKPPNLSRMKGSGSIEEVADAVLILHRQEKDSVDGELIVAKNRDGEAGAIIELGFTPATSLFTEKKDISY